MSRGGRFSRRHRGRPLNAEVNIINLVDVMLVLLVIFMVTAPILQGGIKVVLPKIDTPPMVLGSPLIITVQRGGQVSIGEKRMGQLAFSIALQDEAKRNHPDGVIVRGDAAAPYGEILKVLDQVRRAGMEKAQLATEPTNQ